MRTQAARLLALAVALAATGAGAFSLAPTAQASACDRATGVTVVVDHGHTGGASIGCATGDPATGLEALAASGHVYTFVPRQPGLVCAVDAKPDPCNNAPANGYWSYWHAQPGGSWVYSTAGAGSYNPKPGSVDGWSFGTGKPPSVTVGAALAETSSSTTSSSTPASAEREHQADGRGGLGGLAVGVGLVVPLGAGAAYLAWRRRHVSN